jgi:hypothetical protein
MMIDGGGVGAGMSRGGVALRTREKKSEKWRRQLGSSGFSGFAGVTHNSLFRLMWWALSEG